MTGQLHGHALLRTFLALVLCTTSLTALAGPFLDGDWTPLGPGELDALRGGFTTETGLQVSLGIERVVSINGEVVARTSLHVADVRQPGMQQVNPTNDVLAALALVQNGAGNSYQAQLSEGSLGGTVIQNSLSDQRIVTRTTIDASVNSIDLIKSLNFQGSLSDAIARAATPR